LFKIFKSARGKFYNITKDLYAITETSAIINPGPDEYELTTRELDDDLTEEEIEIISYLMIVVFYERKLANDELYSVLELTTSDFKQLSKANQLSQIRKTVKEYEEKAKNRVEMYDRIKNDAGSVTTFIDEMGDN